jgi:DNA-binding transcriptional ArsR family regulator
MLQALPQVPASGLDFQLQARILKALAHPARLQLVHRLYQGECSVNELAALTGLDRTTVSKHLTLLKRSGMVGERRVGTTLLHHLRTPCVVQFFSCAAQVLESPVPQAAP